MGRSSQSIPQGRQRSLERDATPTVIVASEAPPAAGGMQRWLLDLIGGYATTRRTLVVADEASDSSALLEAGAEAWVPIRSFRDRIGTEAAEVAREILAITRREEATRVHLSQAGLGFLAGPLGSAGIDCALTVHGNDLTRPWLGPKADTDARLTLARRHLAEVPRVQAVSHNSAALARDAGASGPVAVIPPVVDVTRWIPGDRTAARRRLGLPIEAPVVLSVGRPVPRKGHRDVAEALGRLSEDVHWVVAGGTPEGAGNQVSIPNPARGRLDERRSTSDAELLDLYRAADLFVLAPYEHEDRFGRSVEGFGIVFLEAAACELPVVATVSGGVPDAVVDGITGRLVPPRDPAALSAAIGELLADPNRRQSLGAAGRERATREFSPDALASRLSRNESEPGEVRA